MTTHRAAQFVGAFKKVVFEGETKEKFEEKIVTPLKAATSRMKHAKKIMPEVTTILTKFHEKVRRKCMRRNEHQAARRAPTSHRPFPRCSSFNAPSAGTPAAPESP